MRDIRQIIVDGVGRGVPLAEIYAGLGGAVAKTEFYRTVLSLIETGGIPNVMICWCGVDCSRCRTFRATVDDDDKTREAVKGYYQEIGHNIEIKDLRCFGCRSDEMMPGCAGCPYMRCGKEKGLARCGECGEYPCESLRWYTENYIKPGMGKFIIP